MASFGETVAQSYDDGILEFCAAETMIELSLGKMARVGQIAGPIAIKFRTQPGQFIVYLQVDGECYKILNPYSMNL